MLPLYASAVVSARRMVNETRGRAIDRVEARRAPVHAGEPTARPTAARIAGGDGAHTYG
jgi:hypothetical protein